MAVLDMKLYDDLESNIKSAKQNNEQYTVQMTKIKKKGPQKEKKWS